MKIREKIILITLSILTIFLVNMFIFNKKIEFSENEFRYLAKFNAITFESILNRDTMDNIEEYLSDHFPLREEFIKLKNRVELLLGKNKINGVYITDSYLIEEYLGFDKKDQFIDVINTFKDNNKDIKISLMLVPTSISVNDKYLNKYSKTNEQIKDIEYVYNKTNTNNISVIEELRKSKKQVYYYTDHHWTTYGALIAYNKFMNKSDELELKKVSSKFKGTLYSKILISDTLDDIYIYEVPYNIKVTYDLGNEKKVKDTLYNMSYLDKKDKYSLFLDNNNPLIKIENEDLKTKNNILVVKDSYANSFVPFLTNDYHTIHVIDPRYYLGSITEYIKKNNIEEVLFLYNINNINNDTGIYRIK